MKCSVGDSIHAKVIQSYESLPDRVDFLAFNEHGLSYDEIKDLYSEVVTKVKNFCDITEKSLITNYSGIKAENITLSVTYNRKSYYDYVSPDTQSIKIATLLQNLMIVKYGNMKYLNFINKRVRGNLTKLSKAYLKPYYSGFCIQDFACTCYDGVDEVEKFLNSMIDAMNTQLTSCKILRIDINKETVKPSDNNLMIGTLNRDVFKDIVQRYQEWYIGIDDKVEIIEQDIRASIHLMLEKKMMDKSLLDIKIAQKDNKWVMGIYAPINISPYLIIKKLYPKVKLNDIYHNSEFLIAGVYKDISKVIDSESISTDSKVCSCGSDLVYDMVNRKVSRVCHVCQMKLLMSNYVSRK